MELATNVLPLDRNFFDLPLFHRGDKVAEGDIGWFRLLFVQQIEEQQKHQPQHQPERDVSRKLIHTTPDS
jgi:hypothetical protein